MTESASTPFLWKAMRELPGYRQTLEWLSERTDGKVWLKQKEVAELLGVNRKTVRERFGISGGGVALPVLAKILTEESYK